MVFLWQPASRQRCSATARCSSESSPSDERVMRPGQESTTAPHRTATACWSAARPESNSHVSHCKHVWNIRDTYSIYSSRPACPPLALPKFLSHPESVAVDEGGVSRLTCQVNGIPEATITWQRDRRPLSTEDPRYKWFIRSNQTDVLLMFTSFKTCINTSVHVHVHTGTLCFLTASCRSPVFSEKTVACFAVSPQISPTLDTATRHSCLWPVRPNWGHRVRQTKLREKSPTDQTEGKETDRPNWGQRDRQTKLRAKRPTDQTEGKETYRPNWGHRVRQTKLREKRPTDQTEGTESDRPNWGKRVRQTKLRAKRLTDQTEGKETDRPNWGQRDLQTKLRAKRPTDQTEGKETDRPNWGQRDLQTKLRAKRPTDQTEGKETDRPNWGQRDRPADSGLMWCLC